MRSDEARGRAVELARHPDAPQITRRDFVDGTLIGSGGALLSMASPGALRDAAAQTVKWPITGRDESWTGPGGPGDYATSNGDTHQVVNDAHGALRNRDYDRALRAAIDTGESGDAIVIGCGISGLSAAWVLFNFLQSGVIGYVRQTLDGLDSTDWMYLASFPGGHAGTARHFLTKVVLAAIEGEYRMADILNGRVRWDQLDKTNEPVRMRPSATWSRSGTMAPPAAASH
jgi:hypothetical protein